MIYCMADIHGEHDRFMKMLETIEFSEEDTLYIIGDVIDRSPGGIDILQKIMTTPNMVMILGNHEQMCLDTLGPNSIFGSRQLWTQNGGSKTYRELMYITQPPERRKIINFLLKLPDHLNIEVDGRKFHLVHGMPADNSEDRIWERPNPDSPAPIDGIIAIIGHTPTPYLTGNWNDPFTIWYGNGIIDIDCGCGNPIENRRLACLRLDDMKEFYV